MVFRALSSELVKHGHEMVVFTSYPADLVLANYTEINLSILVREWNRIVNYMDFAKKGPWSFLQAVLDHGEVVSEIVLSHPAMQNILAPNSTEKFDLILMQQMFYDALYALPIRLNVPMIGMCTSHILFQQYIHFGMYSLSEDHNLGKFVKTHSQFVADFLHICSKKRIFLLYKIALKKCPMRAIYCILKL